MSYPSGWAEFQRRHDEREEEAKGATNGNGNGNGNGGDPAGKRRSGSKKPAQKAARRAAKLEERIAKAEAALAKLEEELADPAAWSNPGRSESNTERHNAAKAAVAELYAEWEAAQASAEEAEAAAPSRA